jgi:hypothetical protein
MTNGASWIQTVLSGDNWQKLKIDAVPLDDDIKISKCYINKQKKLICASDNWTTAAVLCDSSRCHVDRAIQQRCRSIFRSLRLISDNHAVKPSPRYCRGMCRSGCPCCQG